MVTSKSPLIRVGQDVMTAVTGYAYKRILREKIVVPGQIEYVLRGRKRVAPMFTIHDLMEIWLVVQWVSHGVRKLRALREWLPAYRRLIARATRGTYDQMKVVSWWEAVPKCRVKFGGVCVVFGDVAWREEGRAGRVYSYIDGKAFADKIASLKKWVCLDAVRRP